MKYVMTQVQTYMNLKPKVFIVLLVITNMNHKYFVIVMELVQIVKENYDG